MKRYGPIPKTVKLANTLAQRVTQLRELRNLTMRDLSRNTKFGIRRIEDIQSGLETWLSAADRQVLAKALSVEPALIEEVEVRSNQQLDIVSQTAMMPEPITLDLTRAILEGVRKLNCPMCGHELNCSLQHGLDIEEKPIQLAKAHCTRCPFVLR